MRAFLLFLLAAVASGFAPAAWRPTPRVALHAITDPGSEAMIEGDKLRKNMKERIDKAESKLLSEIKMPDLPAAAPVDTSRIAKLESMLSEVKGKAPADKVAEVEKMLAETKAMM